MAEDVCRNGHIRENGFHCKECQRNANRKYREKNRDKRNAQSREYFRNISDSRREKYNSARRGKVSIRESTLKRRYGITPDEFDALLESQSNLCKICSRRFDSSSTDSRPAVDHDHKTHRVRGLLCPRCNAGLGQFMDSTDFLSNAIEYLKDSHDSK